MNRSFGTRQHIYRLIVDGDNGGGVTAPLPNEILVPNIRVKLREAKNGNTETGGRNIARYVSLDRCCMAFLHAFLDKRCFLLLLVLY